MSGSRVGLAVLVALLALPASDALAATAYTVHSDSLYVRNKAKGYVIGTLRTGDRIDIQRKAGGHWGYGLVYGEFGQWGGRRCGWVQLSGARSTGQKAASGCPRPGRFLRETTLFQRGSYLARAGTGAVRPVNLLACPASTAFGNYDPASRNFATGYGAMPPGRGPEAPGFGLRYVTADGGAALLKDTGNPAGAPAWFFMPAGCVERLPVRVGDHEAGPGVAVAVGDATEEPTALEPFSDATVVGLHWKRFGALRAQAAGTARVNACDPFCAVGPIRHRRGARVTLSAPRVADCAGTRSFLYTQAAVSWPPVPGVWRKRHTTRHRLLASCAGAGKPFFCDGVPIGRYDADVTATNVRCPTALRLFRSWRGNPRRSVRGFSCHRRHDRYEVNVLSCARGGDRVDANWGSGPPVRP